MSLEFHVKCRDAFQQLADALSEEIEKRAPPEVKYGEEDFNKLFWEDLQGSKGPFQRTSKKATQNHPVFQALQAILKEHNGFVHIGAWKYWFDQGNSEVIDRRRK
jgi:hypothetical protein